MDFAYDRNTIKKPKNLGRRLTKIFFILLITSCAGCSAPSFRVYEGPRRPSFSVSRITTRDESIWFTQIDNVYLEHSPFKTYWYNKKYAQDIEALPGKHDLYILHKDLFTEKEFKVTLETEADHIYEVDVSMEDFATVYRIIDLKTRKTILTRYGDKLK